VHKNPLLGAQVGHTTKASADTAQQKEKEKKGQTRMTFLTPPKCKKDSRPDLNFRVSFSFSNICQNYSEMTFQFVFSLSTIFQHA